MRPHVRISNAPAGAQSPRRIGLIINPIAGMGGPAGLKGTDGRAALVEARARGAVPVASKRAERALLQLRALKYQVSIVAAAGPMGADLARSLGFDVTAVGIVAGETTADDTRAAMAAMRGRDLALLMFAGGDGTARDILDGGLDCPLLGIPTGVKMHSAVFATSPEQAGRVATHVLSAEPDQLRWREAEVMDLDEDLLRQGRVAARLHGTAQVPAERGAMQASKAPDTGSDDAELDALARRIVREMEPGRLYVLGCGTTVRRIKRMLGQEGTLLGIDVALDRRLIATDVDEARLLRLLQGARASCILGVTGGQGYILGRGNQQISPRVLRLLGRDAITIIAGQRKLALLDPPCLRADTGEPDVDATLAGYMRVHTAPGRTTIMRIAT